MNFSAQWPKVVICLIFIHQAVSSMADATQTYNFYCAQCHGIQGKGDGPNITPEFATTPRDYTNQAEMEKLTDAEIRNVILDGGTSVGKSSLMPAWSKTLSDSQVEDMVAVLREFCQCTGPAM